MDIGQVCIRECDGDRVEVAAEAGGRPLFVRMPRARLARDAVGDALALFVLIPAMRAGTPLRVPPAYPVSSRLAEALPGIQRVYRSWNPRLQAIEVDARLRAPQADGRGTGVYYAGGVDASYTLLTHLDEIDTLVAIFGFDLTMNAEEMRISRERNAAFARHLGKAFVVVESNHRTFLRDLGVSRMFGYGAMLGAIGLLLGFARCYIASSHAPAYIRPGGAHPVLDWRFSNGTTDIVHDDASLSRYQKTLAVAQRRDFLDNLRVCWEDPNANCGRCSKCLRTMVALRLCGATGPFPPLDDLRRVRDMAAASEHDYVIELVLEARRGGDEALVRALRSGLRRQDLREAVRHLGYALTGRRMRDPFARRNPAEADLIKHELRPDLDPG